MHKPAKDIQVGDTVFQGGEQRVVTEVSPGMHKGSICIAWQGGWSSQPMDTLIEIAEAPEAKECPRISQDREAWLRTIQQTRWSALSDEKLRGVVKLISD